MLTPKADKYNPVKLVFVPTSYKLVIAFQIGTNLSKRIGEGALTPFLSPSAQRYSQYQTLQGQEQEDTPTPTIVYM